jgi:hypothetical protein
MHFNRIVLTAVTLFGLVQAAAAQSVSPVNSTRAAGNAATTPSMVATVDITRLPIDLRRIERQFREGEIREERRGLDLRYFVEVYGRAPNIVLFTKEDNLEYGPAPYGGPTHREMLEMMTPRQFRNHGGVNILNPNPGKK